MAEVEEEDCVGGVLVVDLMFGVQKFGEFGVASPE